MDGDGVRLQIMLPLRTDQLDVLRRALAGAMATETGEALMVLVDLMQRIETVAPLLGCRNVY